MRYCQFCDRPANLKITARDEWERVREVFVCDAHAPPPNAFLNGFSFSVQVPKERRDS